MNNEQERAEFEGKFPMPDNCQWCGNGYAPTEYNAWGAQSYVDMFRGWIARAALQSRGRESDLANAAKALSNVFWSHPLDYDKLHACVVRLDHARRVEGDGE